MFTLIFNEASCEDPCALIAPVRSVRGGRCEAPAYSTKNIMMLMLTLTLALMLMLTKGLMGCMQNLLYLLIPVVPFAL